MVFLGIKIMESNWKVRECIPLFLDLTPLSKLHWNGFWAIGEAEIILKSSVHRWFKTTVSIQYHSKFLALLAFGPPGV